MSADSAVTTRSRLDDEDETNPNKPKTGCIQTKSRNTVTVGCKLPSGIILRTFTIVESGEATPFGFKNSNVAVPDNDSFTLKGAAVGVGFASGHVIGGFALTHNVPAELWEKWLDQNQDSLLVRNNLIFAAKDQDSAADMARERAKLKLGLEPIDPDNPQERSVDFKNIRKGTKTDDE